jgi:hypothetical protein
MGQNALKNNTSGSNNVGIGYNAGQNLTTGADNIDIGNEGRVGDSGVIRIGKNGTQASAFVAGIAGTAVNGSPVVVSANGKLGVAPSSAQFKDEIKPMDRASEAILALKPMTFHYKSDLDPEGIPQFGLVAEQVEKVDPQLVTRDAHGKAYTVRYEAVNAMLLNEFLKEHRKVEAQSRREAEQQASIAKLESMVTQQQEQIKALAASLKAQASQIQKVNAELALQKPGARLADTRD